MIPPRSLSAQMSRLAVPIYLSNLVEMALPILTFFRIGQSLGKEELAAASRAAFLAAFL